MVATVLTVYGIETRAYSIMKGLKDGLLQQYLPFTVLKPVQCLESYKRGSFGGLQQYLPFTVLKLKKLIVATMTAVVSCNSTYRLRY